MSVADGSNELGGDSPDVPVFQALRQITRIRVRYADTDAAGIVHYAKYLAYLEIARAEALHAVGLGRESVAAFSLAAPVLEARLYYRSPARFDELLEVAAWVTEISEMQCRWLYEVRRQGASDLVLTAETEHRWSDGAQALQSSSVPLRVIDALKQLADTSLG